LVLKHEETEFKKRIETIEKEILDNKVKIKELSRSKMGKVLSKGASAAYNISKDVTKKAYSAAQKVANKTAKVTSNAVKSVAEASGKRLGIDSRPKKEIEIHNKQHERENKFLNGTNDQLKKNIDTHMKTIESHQTTIDANNIKILDDATHEDEKKRLINHNNVLESEINDKNESIDSHNETILANTKKIDANNETIKFNKRAIAMKDLPSTVATGLKNDSINIIESLKEKSGDLGESLLKTGKKLGIGNEDEKLGKDQLNDDGSRKLGSTIKSDEEHKEEIDQSPTSHLDNSDVANENRKTPKNAERILTSDEKNQDYIDDQNPRFNNSPNRIEENLPDNYGNEKGFVTGATESFAKTVKKTKRALGLETKDQNVEIDSEGKPIQSKNIESEDSKVGGKIKSNNQKAKKNKTKKHKKTQKT
jgi:hypothetical protein